MGYKIFIIEDDKGIAQGLKAVGESWDMKVTCAENFHDVMNELREADPQLVLIDISLPFFNGFHWCQEIRKESQIPIIFISSAADNMNIIMAMNMGADDFIAKPFDQSVLIAKIQALLRRSYGYGIIQQQLECRGAVLSVDDNTIKYNGQKISLTKNEYRIMLTLMQNLGKTVSREKLMEALWETDLFVDETTLTVNVGRLRKKLDAAGLNDYIVTRFGIGYIIGDEK